MNPALRLPLALLLLILAPPLLAAQSYAIDQGSILIGGTAGFSSTGSGGDGDRFTQVNVNPSLQYFVTRGLSLGGDVTIRRASQGGNSTTLYGVGPSAMYFFGGEERSVYPYLSATVGYWRSEGDDALGYGGSAGAIVMLMDAVGLNGSLYYTRTDNDGFSNDEFGLAAGIAAFIF